MKKILVTGMLSLLLLCTTSSPAQAQTQSAETQRLILVLLQKVAELQLQALQAKEVIDSLTSDGATITNKSNPVAVFKTNVGVIEIELFKDTMPITSQNFIDLTRAGFYNQTKFHRVIDDFMIQGGDPLSKTTDVNRYGTGGPGYTIKDEFVSGTYLTNIKGSLSMANAGPNSGGSQFFINLADNQNLDFNKQPLSSRHPVFGHVVKGLNVVDAIGDTPTNNRDLPIKSVVIESITIK